MFKSGLFSLSLSPDILIVPLLLESAHWHAEFAKKLSKMLEKNRKFPFDLFFFKLNEFFLEAFMIFSQKMEAIILLLYFLILAVCLTFFCLQPLYKKRYTFTKNFKLLALQHC